MDPNRILYLGGADVEHLGAGDMKLALEDVEESTKGRINAIPSYIGGRFGIAGIKWIGGNHGNLQKGLPRASALTVLNDPNTKFPICVMNGADISAVRTGDSSGVAAKYLAKKNAETILLVGAGYQNQMQLEAIYTACPSLKYFYVVDIIKEAEERFAAKMGRKLGIHIQVLNSYSQCGCIPDITVNATSAPVPVMDIAAAHPGGLHICVGGLDHPDLYRKADKIVCDSWNQVKYRPVCYMAQDENAGRFDETKIYAQEIGEIIAGEKNGREHDNEFCYYKPVGMGVLDLAIAVRIYRKAMEQSVGIWLEY